MESFPARLTSDNRQLSGPTPTSDAAEPYSSPRNSLILQHYLRHAVPENTRRAYESDLRHFRNWGGRVPATDAMVAEYLAAHSEILSVAALERRLASLSKAHATLGLVSPTRSHLVKTALRGIRRCHGSPARQAAPLMWDDLAAIVASMGESLKDRRDRALILMGFFGAFRRSELCAVNCNDLEFGPDGILVRLRRSKTDQERRGRIVSIGADQSGCCSVSAMRAWLSAGSIDQGPVFRSVSRHGRLSSRTLSPEAVNLIIKLRVKAIGLDPTRYSGHSLRAGFVTNAAYAGLPTWRIRAQTGHKSDAILGRYIRHESEMPLNRKHISLIT